MPDSPNPRTFESPEVYVMGYTTEEFQRLKRQAQVWEKATRAILEEARLREGFTCLDVGCGPGEVMRLMGERVGRTGKVTGLDSDSKIGREALGVLKSSGISNFEFHEGDLDHLVATTAETYDLVYARFLLLHLTDPAAGLRKMYQLTKPGGSIVVQDYDFRTWDAYPPAEAVNEIRRTFYAVYQKVGRDLNLGSKIPSLFVKAGIGLPDGTRVDGQLTTAMGDPPMTIAGYQSILPLALKFGIVTEEESRAVIERAKEELADKSRYGLWPLCIGAWKRKPA